MQILIRTVTGKNYMIDTERDETVEQLKEKLFELSGLYPEMQRLIFRGKYVQSYSIAILLL
jgi:ubiquitin-like protein Nedd8